MSSHHLRFYPNITRLREERETELRHTDGAVRLFSSSFWVLLSDLYKNHKLECWRIRLQPAGQKEEKSFI